MTVAVAIAVGILCGSLAGCGGFNSTGCGAGMLQQANPAHSGNYTGTGDYPGTQFDLTFALTIAPNGDIAGTATETSSQRTANVTGSFYDIFDGCGTDYISLQLHFQFSDEAEQRNLFGRRNIKSPVSFPFDTQYGNNSTSFGNGNVTLTKN